jgi:nucleotide-binding universal stress UspA family protein
MYTNILIPTDGSELAGKAVQQGITLAREMGARITALTVCEPFHTFTLDTSALEDTPAEYKEHAREHSAKTLSAVAEAAKAAGVPCDTVEVMDEHPYQAIIDTAKAKGCDLVIMASHRRHGLDEVVHGSETLKVLTHSNLPVLVQA